MIMSNWISFFMPFFSWKLAHSSSVWLSSLSPFSFSLCFAFYFFTVHLFPPLIFSFFFLLPSSEDGLHTEWGGKMSTARRHAGTAESDKETSGELTAGEHMHSSVNWGEYQQARSGTALSTIGKFWCYQYNLYLKSKFSQNCRYHYTVNLQGEAQDWDWFGDLLYDCSGEKDKSRPHVTKQA